MNSTSEIKTEALESDELLVADLLLCNESLNRDSSGTASPEPTHRLRMRDLIFLDHAYSQPVLPPEEYSVLALDMSRRDGAVSYGLRISIASGKFLVTAVVEGSPADKAGFMCQDELLSVDRLTMESKNMRLVNISRYLHRHDSVSVRIRRRVVTLTEEEGEEQYTSEMELPVDGIKEEIDIEEKELMMEDEEEEENEEEENEEEENIQPKPPEARKYLQVRKEFSQIYCGLPKLFSREGPSHSDIQRPSFFELSWKEGGNSHQRYIHVGGVTATSAATMPNDASKPTASKQKVKSSQSRMVTEYANFYKPSTKPLETWETASEATRPSDSLQPEEEPLSEEWSEELIDTPCDRKHVVKEKTELILDRNSNRLRLADRRSLACEAEQRISSTAAILPENKLLKIPRVDVKRTRPNRSASCALEQDNFIMRHAAVNSSPTHEHADEHSVSLSKVRKKKRKMFGGKTAVRKKQKKAASGGVSSLGRVTSGISVKLVMAEKDSWRPRCPKCKRSFATPLTFQYHEIRCAEPETRRSKGFSSGSSMGHSPAKVTSKPEIVNELEGARPENIFLSLDTGLGSNAPLATYRSTATNESNSGDVRKPSHSDVGMGAKLQYPIDDGSNALHLEHMSGATKDMTTCDLNLVDFSAENPAVHAPEASQHINQSWTSAAAARTVDTAGEIESAMVPEEIPVVLTAISGHTIAIDKPVVAATTASAAAAAALESGRAVASKAESNVGKKLIRDISSGSCVTSCLSQAAVSSNPLKSTDSSSLSSQAEDVSSTQAADFFSLSANNISNSCQAAASFSFSNQAADSDQAANNSSLPDLSADTTNLADEVFSHPSQADHSFSHSYEAADTHDPPSEAANVSSFSHTSVPEPHDNVLSTASLLNIRKSAPDVINSIQSTADTNKSQLSEVVTDSSQDEAVLLDSITNNSVDNDSKSIVSSKSSADSSDSGLAVDYLDRSSSNALISRSTTAHALDSCSPSSNTSVGPLKNVKTKTEVRAVGVGYVTVVTGSQAGEAASVVHPKKELPEQGEYTEEEEYAENVSEGEEAKEGHQKASSAHVQTVSSEPVQILEMFTGAEAEVVPSDNSQSERLTVRGGDVSLSAHDAALTSPNLASSSTVSRIRDQDQRARLAARDPRRNVVSSPELSSGTQQHSSSSQQLSFNIHQLTSSSQQMSSNIQKSSSCQQPPSSTSQLLPLGRQPKLPLLESRCGSLTLEEQVAAADKLGPEGRLRLLEFQNRLIRRLRAQEAKKATAEQNIHEQKTAVGRERLSLHAREMKLRQQEEALASRLKIVEAKEAEVREVAKKEERIKQQKRMMDRERASLQAREVMLRQREEDMTAMQHSLEAREGELQKKLEASRKEREPVDSSSSAASGSAEEEVRIGELPRLSRLEVECGHWRDAFSEATLDLLRLRQSSAEKIHELEEQLAVSERNFAAEYYRARQLEKELDYLEMRVNSLSNSDPQSQVYRDQEKILQSLQHELHNARQQKKLACLQQELQSTTSATSPSATEASTSQATRAFFQKTLSRGLLVSRQELDQDEVVEVAMFGRPLPEESNMKIEHSKNPSENLESLITGLKCPINNPTNPHENLRSHKKSPISTNEPLESSRKNRPREQKTEVDAFLKELRANPLPTTVKSPSREDRSNSSSKLAKSFAQQEKSSQSGKFSLHQEKSSLHQEKLSSYKEKSFFQQDKSSSQQGKSSLQQGESSTLKATKSKTVISLGDRRLSLSPITSPEIYAYSEGELSSSSESAKLSFSPLSSSSEDDVVEIPIAREASAEARCGSLPTCATEKEPEARSESKTRCLRIEDLRNKILVKYKKRDAIGVPEQPSFRENQETEHNRESTKSSPPSATPVRASQYRSRSELSGARSPSGPPKTAQASGKSRSRSRSPADSLKTKRSRSPESRHAHLEKRRRVRSRSRSGNALSTSSMIPSQYSAESSDSRSVSRSASDFGRSPSAERSSRSHVERSVKKSERPGRGSRSRSRERMRAEERRPEKKSTHYSCYKSLNSERSYRRPTNPIGRVGDLADDDSIADISDYIQLN